MTSKKTIKAVGLLSGGLDSTLAAKVVKDLGVDVHGVYFSMPWGCCDKAKAFEAAQKIGIKFITLQLDERYLEIVRKPKHGYGSAMNPCVDCRIHMFSRAAQYMRHIGADFIFTGEVLGQRQMSQLRHSMKWVEEGSGLTGKLLRPLCAQLLEQTEVEKNGLIDRKKLLNLSGRSRREQIRLTEELNITEYNQPAGGCLLTDKNFARRMTDTLQYGYRNFRETIALKWGRHFRINKDFKAILGRNDDENTSLLRYAHKDDTIMQFSYNAGGTLILKGPQPNSEILSIAAGLIQRFSKFKNEAPQEINYWPVADKNNIQTIKATLINDAQFDKIKI